MAIRKLRYEGDPILNKVCKPVYDMTDRTLELIEDMAETMYETGGVGLAAPQVGILKRICVIDVTPDCSELLILINPEIIETSGSQTGSEGCLSVPNKSGTVTRPNVVKVKALNTNMEEVIIEGTELLARALCHEIDHLDGKLYIDLVEGDLETYTDED
ncbi:MAG: peptide deformylase [Lachnospiraceae bacterium]|nr:peptide deformylase [Lachnospiraceae bacterium]